MTCPTADKLSRFHDGLIPEEQEVISRHIEQCASCRQVLEAFGGEDAFIQKTLQEPGLPDDFTDSLLAGLEPYPAKRRRPPFLKRTLAAVAGLLLTVGITSAFSPAFAQWIGGFFTSVNVDEGIQIAAEEGYAKRIDQSVTDTGLTFKVEDLVADSSRVTFSYQILDAKGKAKDPELETREVINKLYIKDAAGKEIELSGQSWYREDSYGVIEFSLRDQTLTDSIFVGFDLTELAGKTGRWKLEIPLDLKETLQATEVHDLSGYAHEENGVSIRMKETRFAPSSSEIFYETGFSDSLLKDVEKKMKIMEDKYGREIAGFNFFDTAVQYRIEDEKGRTVSRHSQFSGDVGETDGLLQGTGEDLGTTGANAWNESFVPQRSKQKLFLAMEGVIKTVPADFSITFEPKKLGRQPASFKYEGNEMKIVSARMHSRLHLRKSVWPVGREKTFQIEIEGSKTPLAPEMFSWVLVDDKGKAYETFRSGSLLNAKEDGRQPASTLLTIYGLDEVPDKLTLRLLSEIRYEPLEKEWKIPIN